MERARGKKESAWRRRRPAHAAKRGAKREGREAHACNVCEGKGGRQRGVRECAQGKKGAGARCWPCVCRVKRDHMAGQKHRVIYKSSHLIDLVVERGDVLRD